MELSGAVALVTGSSRGIGRDVAERLVARNAKVVLHGRDPATLQPLARRLGASCVAVDLSEPGGGGELARRAVAVHGRIDIVVHSAGAGYAGRLIDMPAERVTRLLALDLLAPLELSRALLPGMVSAGRGHLAFIGSIAGLTGVADEAVYSAAKAGLVTFADSLRLELAGTGVGVSTVNPGAVRTDFFAQRGAPYGRRVPRPMPVARVGAAVVAAIDHERARTVLPPWLALAPAVRTIAPRAYAALARRLA